MENPPTIIISRPVLDIKSKKNTEFRGKLYTKDLELQFYIYWIAPNFAVESSTSNIDMQLRKQINA